MSSVTISAHFDPDVEGVATATLQATYQPLLKTLAYTVTLAGIDASTITSATLSYGKPGDNGTAVAELLPLPQAGASITGSVVLNEDSERWLAAGLLHLRLGGSEFSGGAARGQLLFAQPVLHLPLYAAPRPVAEMNVEPQTLTLMSGTKQALAFTGNSLQGSAPPTDVVPLATVMELKLRSPNIRPPWLDTTAPDRYDQADLQYVGVTSDAALGLSTAPEDARIYFGIATWADWSTPSEITVNILLDTDGDGQFEYRLANGSPTAPIFGLGSIGPLVSELYDLSSGQLISQQPLNAVPPAQYDANPFFNNVMVLPVKLADLGVAAGGGNISFEVQTTSADLPETAGSYIDRSPLMRYDPVRPALLFSPPGAAAPMYLERPGAAVDVAVNPAGYPFNPPAGVLVLHHHNFSSERVSVVNLFYRWPSTSYLPIIDQGAKR